MSTVEFNFENLEVWRKSISFAREIIALTESFCGIRKHFKIAEQLEAAALSVSSNIAEGAGRFSKKEFINFLYIARGSLCETVSILTIYYQEHWLREDNFTRFKLNASEISRMISGLINSLRR